MFLRMVYDEALAQAAYIIGCQRTGEAIVIDPERDVDRYERIAAANGLRIVAAAETHIHADFLSGVRELGEKGAKVYVSGEGGPEWSYGWLESKVSGGAYSHRVLKDGDRFEVGSIEFTVVHTPGHTPEHLCFMVTDRGGGADRPMGVLTGDFVFVGDLGRPDLLESAAGIRGQAAASAERLYETVRRFMEWPDYLQVWPAHGAGSACGKALGAVPQTTVGYEKMFSPALRVSASRRQFTEFILEGQPEPPLYFARMKRENRAGPRVLGGVPRPREVSAAELLGVVKNKGLVIDTRPWAKFRSGHVPGSLFVALNNSFSTDAGSMVEADEGIHVIVDAGRVDEAVRGLIRVGLDRIEGWFDAAKIPDLTGAGVVFATTAEVTAEQASGMVRSQEAFLLDVRRRSEFDEGHIPGAANITHTRLRDRLAEVPRERPVLVNCRSGGRSARACSLLQRNGYRVMNLAGGMTAWETSGGTVER